ncbi:DUF5979 domain-containing protein [Actinomyces lilanjuaniae]|uniref:DUF7926 domain-containing protein n=1 Tax=Actinomyces lilanjuaniae TaxID=2321394 RepID=UPI00242C6319|nr:DUF5979 domain-containing protein [Actinomyces lilanjuaniae]
MSPTSPAHRSKAPSKAFVAAVLAMLLSLTGALMSAVLPTAAQAADNPGIIVSDLRLVKSSNTGQDDPDDTTITAGDVLRLSFTWDARNANAKSGDSFSIGLPEVFRNREFPLSQPLSVTYNGTQTTIGTCELDQQNITCTFNEQLDSLVDQGFSGLNGSGSALIVAEQPTESSTADINANGTVRTVEIPGGRIGEYTGFPYSPESLRKWASPLTATSTSLDWELNFGTPAIEEALAAGGNPITVDGQTVSTITFTDRLTPGQTYDTTLSNWTLDIGKSATSDTAVGTVTDAAGQDHDTSQGNFDLEVEINGDEATIRVTGPFAPNTNYSVYYSSFPTTDNQTIQAGVEYENNATLAGTTLESSYLVYYTRSFTIDVSMEAGFGGLNITKLLSGEAAPRVPEGTTFTVGIDYTLPGGATVDTYEGWTAPGEVNADRTGGTTTMEVTLGAITTYNGTFPAGTVLTLSEDPTTASTTPAGATWGTPVFTVGGETTTSLTVADQTSTAITLRNTADEAETPVGSFSVAKAVEGGEDLTSKEFTFTFTCDDADTTTGTLTATGNGTAVDADLALPEGTQCTITEDIDAAQEDGYTLTPPEPQTITITAGDQTATATFTNTYTPEETPEPTETPTETPEPSETPTETPEPTETPTETPEPTETPTETPEPSETPTETPEPTETPTETPEPTETPSEPATETPESSETPSEPATETPESSETPSEPATETPESSETPASPQPRLPSPARPPANPQSRSLLRRRRHQAPVAALRAGRRRHQERPTTTRQVPHRAAGRSHVPGRLSASVLSRY